MPRWSVALAPNTTSKTDHHDEQAESTSSGQASTVAAAWLAAADAALGLLAARPEDDWPALLRVSTHHGPDQEPVAADSAGSLLVAAPARDHNGSLELPQTRAGIHELVVAILGAHAATTGVDTENDEG